MMELSYWLGALSLCLMSGSVLVSATLWSHSLRRQPGGLWLLSLATMVCAQVVVIVAGLGLVGALSVPTMLVSAVGVAAASAAGLGWRRAAKETRETLRWCRAETSSLVGVVAHSATWPGYLAAAAALLVVGARGLSQPPFVYDDLFYHLTYPADWLRTGRLDIPYAPWGGNMAPFYGLNTELISFWLLAPLGSDVIAKMGQTAALILLSVAVYVVARELGAGQRPSMLVALLPWSSPAMMTEAFFNVNGDLWAATFLVATIGLSLALWRRGSDFIVPASLAMGLFLGTKAYSPLYAPFPFLVLTGSVAANRLSAGQRGSPPEWSGLARDIGLSSFLVFVSGGFWFGRNLLLIHNPILPSLDRMGFAIQNETHGEGVAYSLSGFLLGVRNHGVMVPALMAGFIVTGLLLAAMERRGDHVRFDMRLPVLLLPLVLFPLIYTIPPSTRFGRFLMPAIAAGYPAVALVLSRVGGLPIAPAAAFLGSLAVGAYPLYLVAKHMPPSSVAVASPWAELLVASLLGLAALWVASRLPSPVGAKGALGVVLVLAVLVSLGQVVDGSRNYRYDAWQRYGDGDIGKGWAWVERTTAPDGAVIAYAGTNLAYPLYGSRYQNRVLAVPLNGDASATHYGFGREMREVVDAPDEARWRRALADLGVEYLFVSNSGFLGFDGFPLEDSWARADVERFHLVHSTEGTRVYRFHPE